MSTEYNVAVMAGFKFATGVLLKPFKHIYPEKSQMERRWDIKTGKEVKPEKVVREPEYVVYKLGKKEWDTEFEFINALGNSLRCTYGMCLDNANGLEFVVLGPYVKPAGKVYEDWPLYLDRGLLLQDLFDKKDRFLYLATKLRRIGLKLPKPQIHLVWSIG